jgi:hypothetical protein
MFDAMGIPAGGTHAAWRSAAEAWFRAQFEQPACFAAFVGGGSRSGTHIRTASSDPSDAYQSAFGGR